MMEIKEAMEKVNESAIEAQRNHLRDLGFITDDDLVAVIEALRNDKKRKTRKGILSAIVFTGLTAATIFAYKKYNECQKPRFVDDDEDDDWSDDDWDEDEYGDRDTLDENGKGDFKETNTDKEK